jgi:hypothetical protein
MGTHVLSRQMGSTSTALVFGLVVTGLLIAAETLVVYRQRRVAPEISLGAGLSGGWLVVSAAWGLVLGVTTSVLSTALGLCYIPPFLDFVPSDFRGPAARAILLAVARVVALARSIGADQRRGDADLAAAMARVLLAHGRHALLAAAPLRTSSTGANAVGCGDRAGGGRGRGAAPGGPTARARRSPLVAVNLPRVTGWRLWERVAPAEALWRARGDRERMGSADER